MKHLPKRRNIIITTADKYGAVVIMDTENSIKEANRHFFDRNNYKILQIDSTLQHNKMVNDTLDQINNKNLLPKKTSEGLKAINPKKPKCYIRLKMHKKNNTGRPVINSINCDHHLQLLVKEISSNIKDTEDFVNKLYSFKVPKNSVLVTMDVKAFFINISNNEGITAVKGNTTTAQRKQ